MDVNKDVDRNVNKNVKKIKWLKIIFGAVIMVTAVKMVF